MTTRLPMICDSCIHRDPDGIHCAAFPDGDGIPLDPMKAETHFQVRIGQENDIVYELEPGMEEEKEDFDAFLNAFKDSPPKDWEQEPFAQRTAAEESAES